MVNKRECLECLFTEINILTECRHPNVVKILDASFDGTLVKEEPIVTIPKNIPNLKGKANSPKEGKKKKDKSPKQSARSGDKSETN